MTGTKHDTQDAPNKRSRQRDEWRAFDGVAEVGKKLFHVLLAVRERFAMRRIKHRVG